MTNAWHVSQKYRLWQKNILLYLFKDGARSWAYLGSDISNNTFGIKYPWGTKRMYLIAKEILQKGIIRKGDARGDARRVTNGHKRWHRWQAVTKSEICLNSGRHRKRTSKGLALKILKITKLTYLLRRRSQIRFYAIDEISNLSNIALRRIQAIIKAIGPVPSPNKIFWSGRKVYWSCLDVRMTVTKYLDRFIPYKIWNGDLWPRGLFHNYPKGGNDLLGYIKNGGLP